VIALAVFGASASAMVSASIGTAFLHAARLQSYSGLDTAWLVYWLGDAMGALIVTPLALTIADVLTIRDKARFLELLALLLVLPVVCVAVFGDLSSFSTNVHLTAFAVLPFVLWASARLGMGITTFSIFLVSTVATIDTALGYGPFASGNPFINAVRLDTFFGIIGITGLVLAAVTSEREHAELRHDQIVDDHELIRERLRIEQAIRRRLIEAQEQERMRIARDLHDDVGQRLAVLAIEIEQIEVDTRASLAEQRTRVGDLHRLVEEVSSSLQTISHELHSSKLTYLGIVAAMRSLCGELGKLHKLQIDFRTQDVPDSIPPDISLCLFRILQEGLHNAIKYSGVDRIEVELRGSSAGLDLTVRDRGKGFDVAVAKNDPGLGLISMYERIRLVNGELFIESRPQGGGTTVTAHAPLEPRKDTSSN
jgi:signal transduction histidine kinase